jgi:hypothetical protein
MAAPKGAGGSWEGGWEAAPWSRLPGALGWRRAGARVARAALAARQYD